MKNASLLLLIMMTIILMPNCNMDSSIDSLEILSTGATRSEITPLLDAALTSYAGSSGNYYFQDTSGNGNNLQFVGSTPVISTVAGRTGLQFDGSVYLENTEPGLDIGLEDFSITFSILTSQSSGTILDKRGSDENGYHIIVYSGQILFQMNTATKYFNYWSSSAQAVNDGQWHDIRIDVDRDASNGVQLYIDNQLQWEMNANYLPQEPLNSTGGTFYLGRHKNGGSNLDGYLRDFSIDTITQSQQVFVAVGWLGRIIVSPDGEDWTEAIVPDPDHQFIGVTYANETFVAVGDWGQIMTSTDGYSWTDESISGNQLQAVAYGNGVFVAVGKDGRIVTSPDGAVWTDESEPGYTFRDITFGNNLFVAVGAIGRIMTSTDGAVWTDRSVGGNSLGEVVYTNGIFVAADAWGYTLTSSNGINWSSSPLLDYPLNAIAYGVGKYVGLVGNGLIYSSTNATAWTLVTTTGKQFSDLIYSNGLFVAVGPYGTILTSTDGLSWNDETEAGDHLHAITSSF